MILVILAMFMFLCFGVDLFMAYTNFMDAQVGWAIVYFTLAIWCLVVGIFNLRNALN